MAETIRIQIRRLRGPKAGEERTETLTFPPQGAIVVGRSPEAALRLDHPVVSLSHLAIIKAQGMFWVQDLGSQNGTLLGSARLTPQTRRPCAAGDILFVGPFALSILDPTLDRPLGDAGSTQSLALEAVLKLLQNSASDLAFLTVSSGPVAGTRFPVPMGRPILVGRDPGAHIVFPDPNLSHKHARIYADAEGVWLEDLHSSQGTFVNERRLSGLWKLSTGQTIKMGDTILEFEDPAELVLHDLEAAAAHLVPGDFHQPNPANQNGSSDPMEGGLPEDGSNLSPSPESSSQTGKENESVRLPPAWTEAPGEAGTQAPLDDMEQPRSSRKPNAAPGDPAHIFERDDELSEPLSSFWWIAGLAGGITAILAASGFFLWILTR